jgi:hypothetical protein
VLANVAGIHMTRAKVTGGQRILTLKKVSGASQKTASADPHSTAATLL